MTPAEVEIQARRRYNSVSDTNFYAQADMFQWIYEAEMEMAIRAKVNEVRDTSISTVDGTRTYAFPTDMFEIKRVEYDGDKLGKVDDRGEDTINLGDSDSTETGTPAHYRVWDETFYLRPIPDSAKTLTVDGYKLPTALTTASTTLTTPKGYHTFLIDYVVAQMAFKDENYTAYDRNLAKFENNLVTKVIATEARRKRGDRPAIQRTEEMYMNDAFGVV